MSASDNNSSNTNNNNCQTIVNGNNNKVFVFFFPNLPKLPKPDFKLIGNRISSNNATQLIWKIAQDPILAPVAINLAIKLYNALST